MYSLFSQEGQNSEEINVLKACEYKVISVISEILTKCYETTGKWSPSSVLGIQENLPA
jgi:hypothetical protein